MLSAIAAFKSAYILRNRVSPRRWEGTSGGDKERDLFLSVILSLSLTAASSAVFPFPCPFVCPPSVEIHRVYDAVSPPSSLKPRYYLDFHRSKMPTSLAHIFVVSASFRLSLTLRNVSVAEFAIVRIKPSIYNPYIIKMIQFPYIFNINSSPTII